LTATVVVGCTPVSPTLAPTAPPTTAPTDSPTIAPTSTPAAAATTTPVGQDTSAPAAKAIAALGTDLYRELAREKASFVFSPYSVEVALAMARAGAAGQTADQMDTVLHTAVVGDLNGGLGAVDRELARRAGTYPWGGANVPLELTMANRLWGQSGYQYGAAFLDRLSTHYRASMGTVDYARARDAARKAINDWVSAQTNARIPEIIADGMLTDLTRFVLTNAVYLKAKWQRPFSKEATRPAPFHRLDGTDSEAQLMGNFATFEYGRGTGYQAVSLPYVGGLSMVVIVPDSGSFAAFESGLDGPRLGQVMGGLAHTSVDLSLPRFRFSTGAILTGPLSRMGMPIAFTENADFSGISPNEVLYIQTVAHEAFIAVDEEGTEAAAVTAVIGGATGGPSEWVTLKVDRPFLFVVKDDATGAVLFIGRVLDPR
jgi:serpin B